MKKRFVLFIIFILFSPVVFGIQTNDSNDGLEISVTPLDAQKVDKQNKTNYFLSQVFGTNKVEFSFDLNEQTIELDRYTLFGLFILSIIGLYLALEDKRWVRA